MLQLRVPLHNGGIGVLSVVNVGFTTVDTVALHTCHSAMVWGGPALSMVQIHGTHTTPGTAPWWGQRGTDGTVPLTQQHHGGGGGEKADRLHWAGPLTPQAL